jgi:Periplasmic binding protein-like domain
LKTKPFSGEVAIGFLEALCGGGIRILQDDSVVEFDDIEFVPFCDPTLTNVHQPRAELGLTDARFAAMTWLANRRPRRTTFIGRVVGYPFEIQVVRPSTATGKRRLWSKGQLRLRADTKPSLAAPVRPPIPPVPAVWPTVSALTDPKFKLRPYRRTPPGLLIFRLGIEMKPNNVAGVSRVFGLHQISRP